jgi:hypothetical protein
MRECVYWVSLCMCMWKVSCESVHIGCLCMCMRKVSYECVLGVFVPVFNVHNIFHFMRMCVLGAWHYYSMTH